MARYLGIDVGTTKIAAIVLDTASGGPVAVAAAENASRLETDPDRSEWDAERAIDICLTVARAAIDRAGGPATIRAVGVTGQMHGMLLVDPGLRPLTPFIGWQDQRARTPLGGFPSAIAWLRQVAGPDAPRRLGCTPATGYMGATLFWLARTGQLPAGPGMACFLPDYLVARLCDQAPSTDPTNAASAGLFNVGERRWDAPLLAALDLAPTLLPPVRPTGSIAGPLALAAAESLGLAVGLPVLTALGDNQASFVGSVSHPDDDLLVNIGTGGQVSATTTLIAPPGQLETRPFIDERSLLVGAGVVGGAAYGLLHTFVRQIGQEIFGVVTDDIYDHLNRLAATVPAGSDGLTCDPRFAGTRTEPNRRGSFSHLSPLTFTPGHLARALLEGTAITLHGLYDEMQAAGLHPRRRLIGSGNGIRTNRLLADILADAFQMKLVTPVHTEEAAYGAALLASVATGEQRLTSIGDLIRYAED